MYIGVYKKYVFVFYGFQFYFSMLSIIYVFGVVCSNQTTRALTFRDNLSNFQPVNSHLRPFHAFL